MIRTVLFATALIAAPVAAQTTFSPTDLDANKDGKVVLTKARDGFKAKDVLVPCAAMPTYTYAITCPVVHPVVEDIAAPVITTLAKDYGASSACMYPRPGVSGNFWATRSLDCVLFRVEKPNAWDQLPRTVQDFRIDASREGVTTQPKSNKTSAYTPINNVTLQRFQITARKRGIFIRNGSSNWLIQDFKITGSGVNTSAGDIPGGIIMDGAHNITIRRGEISGFKTKLSGPGYANADPLSAERGDSFTATDLYLHDSTDGGIDTKATTTLDRIRVANIEHYSYRFWATVNAGTLTSENPGGAHIQIASASARVKIAKLIVIGPKAMIHVDSKGIGGEIDVAECDRSGHTGPLTSGFASRAKITLGATCVVGPK